ncbi:putative ABC transporter permease [Neobacillus bataviensis LMG 21833]|uniref:Putative ABC transporter permease n=1 Tax=Neobacillus bataviensis LMG 21833 TaxID=1117379 RepID=K6BUT7_9BACI|nr:ABC transporter permease [Neobacillus bataviensis]EKN62685.1 putative ABC transporter permease [Neobacillus bataviensis LMG 21833]
MKLLKQDSNFDWKKASQKQAEKNVSSQDVVAAVVIPEDLNQRITEKKPLFDIIVQRKTENYLAVSNHVEGTAGLILRSYQATANLEEGAFSKVLETIATNKGVTVDRQIIQKDTNDSVAINLMFVGFAIMFMMFGLSGAASAILDERIGGTWGRLMITPATKLQISLGYLLAYFFMGWIQFAVLMAAMNLMFDTSWGRFTYLIPFASLVILCVVGFGMMIAGLVKTKQQASAISAVLIVSTCMLGGVYWPIDVVPEIMQKIALGVPQTWAMSGFKEIISGSLHTGTLLKDTAALFGFSALFFFIGLKGIKFE